MSSNSNLGYGGMNPYNMSSLVNGTSSNNPANFSSNEVPGLPGLAGAKSNIDAAAGNVPGICNFKGGAKRLKRKIKNITKRYKMKGGKKDFKSIKRKIKSRIRGHNTTLARTMAMRGGRKRRRTRRVMKGGYSQYQNNQPFSMGYSVGGVLGANESALANPGPIKAYNDVVDNYNHFTGKGFSSAGH
jgi:hypothetical protein